MEYKNIHYEITKEDILSGKYDAWRINEPVWWSAEIHYGLERYENDLSKFTKSQRILFAVEWYDSEVCNGGHDQLLNNSTGIVWKDALDGFEMIGAEGCAAVVRSVIEKCGGTIPFDREERQILLDKLTADPENEDEYIDLFCEDDSAYYRERRKLDELALAYIKAHPDDFIFSGDVLVPAPIADRR